MRMGVLVCMSCLPDCSVQPFTYNTRYSPFTGVGVSQQRQIIPGYTNNLQAVLQSAQYTVRETNREALSHCM